MKKSIYFWQRGLWALLSLFFVLIIGMSCLYLYLESELPKIDSLNAVHWQVPLRVFTQDGKLIQEYGEKKSIPITFEDIPKPLINALIATEDQRFFEHSGVDVFGLGRAALRMIVTRTKSQGGSTITMQVARNFFLSRKKTFLRKFNEILLAIKIDNELSKEKILELYFNRIYFGNRAYGVGAAANVYYAKTLKELSLAELAMLAGLPQAPSTQNPIVNPQAALKRRNHVLLRLLEEKYISLPQYQEAVKQPITAKYHGSNTEVKAPYVAEMIRQSLYEHFGEDAYTKGYNVYTTINSTEQLRANQVVAEHLIAYDHRHGYRGAVTNVAKTAQWSKKLPASYLAKYPSFDSMQPVLLLQVGNKDAEAVTKRGEHLVLPWAGIAWARPALKHGWMGKAPTNAKQVLKAGDIVYVSQQEKDKAWYLTQVPEAESALTALNPNNGAIEALVGGFDFDKSKFNRVTQSQRQPGSSFKPFIYAAALHKDYTLATLINDAPIVVDDPSQATLWRPHNVNLKFNGPMRLKEALVRSKNMVSIRILDDLGFDYAIDFVTHFGFQRKQLPKALSLALGTLSVTPMDLTAAYAVFANGGYKIEPYLIDQIKDNEGNVLLQAKPATVCDNCNDNQSSGNAPRVIPADVAFLMNMALKEVTERGTASQARSLNRHDIAGKTGTTNDAVDAWFAGYTPNLVVTTWVGFDQPQPLHEYATNLALPMWIDFMKVALKGQKETIRPQPQNVVSVRIDPKTGLLAKDPQQEAIQEYFREQDVPSEEAPATSQNTEELDTQESLF